MLSSKRGAEQHPSVPHPPSRDTWAMMTCCRRAPPIYTARRHKHNLCATYARIARCSQLVSGGTWELGCGGVAVLLPQTPARRTQAHRLPRQANHVNNVNVNTVNHRVPAWHGIRFCFQHSISATGNGPSRQFACESAGLCVSLGCAPLIGAPGHSRTHPSQPAMWCGSASMSLTLVGSRLVQTRPASVPPSHRACVGIGPRQYDSGYADTLCTRARQYYSG